MRYYKKKIHKGHYNLIISENSHLLRTISRKNFTFDHEIQFQPSKDHKTIELVNTHESD